MCTNIPAGHQKLPPRKDTVIVWGGGKKTPKTPKDSNESLGTEEIDFDKQMELNFGEKNAKAKH